MWTSPLSEALGQPPDPQPIFRPDLLHVTNAVAIFLRCLSLLSIALFLGGGLVSDTSGPSCLVLFIPLSIFLLGAACAVEDAQRNRLNAYNDERAAELWLALREGKRVEPFVLFLRPFFRVGHIPISSRERLGPLLSPFRYFRTPGFDLETLLGEGFGSIGQLIGLGKPLRSSSTGRSGRAPTPARPGRRSPRRRA